MFIVSSVNDDFKSLSSFTDIKISLTSLYTSVGVILPTGVTHMELYLHHVLKPVADIDRKIWQSNLDLEDEELINGLNSIENLLTKIHHNKDSSTNIEVCF